MAKKVRQPSGPPERRPNREAFHVSPEEAHAAPPAVVAGPPRPAIEAVALFEQAMQALQQHDYTAAAEVFRGLMSDYPREGALRERSVVYLALCERELARRPLEPRTVEERLTAATAALNNGDERRAEVLAHSVLSDVPQHDLALYLLAAVEARRGALEEALHFLGRAMAANPEIRAQARHDADFEDLRDMDAFRDLIEAPIPPASDGLRRARRSR
jgi:Tfp pilus assembly protein PilF